MQNKTVFITGATGFLGGALALRLAAEGAIVKALARRPNRDKYLRDVPGIEIVMGDITDAARMRELTQDCDIVFHVAAALNGKLDFQRRVNVDGTRNVAIAAAQANIERFVYVSTIAVYGYSVTGIIDEDTPQYPGNVPYNRSKSEAETALLKVVSDNNLPYSIIRPGMIYGARSAMWT
ncbi:MAG: NAD-dependent epimerase/dehydratase family protein, partial [Aggregatilineales bacterium]